MKAIEILITGKDVDKLDPERIAEYVYCLLCDQYDVTVIGAEGGEADEYI